MANATSARVAGIRVAIEPTDGDDRPTLKDAEKTFACLVETIRPISPFSIEPVDKAITLRTRLSRQIPEAGGLRRDRPTPASDTSHELSN
jgi:hypothetical protein